MHCNSLYSAANFDCQTIRHIIVENSFTLISFCEAIIMHLCLNPGFSIDCQPLLDLRAKLDDAPEMRELFCLTEKQQQAPLGFQWRMGVGGGGGEEPALGSF